MASRRALLLLFSGLILRPTLGSQSSSQEVVAESWCAVLSLSAELSQVLQEGLPGDQSLREEAVGIARRRASQMHSLVFADPASAIRLALTDDQRRQLVSELPELDLLLEESGQWRGSVDVFYDEDFPSGASRMRYVLAQGAKLLEVVPTADNPRVTRSGVVTVTGVRIGAAIAARSIEVEQKAVLTPACTPLGGLRVGQRLEHVGNAGANLMGASHPARGVVVPEEGAASQGEGGEQGRDRSGKQPERPLARRLAVRPVEFDRIAWRHSV